MKKTLMLGAIVTGLVIGAPAAHAGDHKHAKDGMKKSKPGHHKMMEKHDLDGDGAITKEEALKAAEERFNKMDADSDGKVTEDEGHAYYKAKHEKYKEMHKKHKEDGKDKDHKGDKDKHEEKGETKKDAE